MAGSRSRSPEAERARGIREPLAAVDRAVFPIVAIGASAGGLDACKKLLDALPATTGMAFVFVQHLDPAHDSLLVDLLAAHTSMRVTQASDGMEIERDRVHIIPPGVYLSVDDKGTLRLSPPLDRHGARLPFDFLLKSLAAAFGARVVCVVLSGNGADGSVGLKTVSAAGGLVVAQDLSEAEYDGMPRSAIATGAVRPDTDRGRHCGGAAGARAAPGAPDAILAKVRSELAAGNRRSPTQEDGSRL